LNSANNANITMITKIGRSLKAAFNGFKDVLVFEHVFRTMVIFAAIIITAMFYLPTTRTEKAIILVMIFAVLLIELVNSVIERVMDFVHPGHNEKVGEIKDLMASISLVTSLGALVIGLMIFWPYLSGLL